jgi:hypothetical protein
VRLASPWRRFARARPRRPESAVAAGRGPERRSSAVSAALGARLGTAEIRRRFAPSAVSGAAHLGRTARGTHAVPRGSPLSCERIKVLGDRESQSRPGRRRSSSGAGSARILRANPDSRWDTRAQQARGGELAIAALRARQRRPELARRMRALPAPRTRVGGPRRRLRASGRTTPRASRPRLRPRRAGGAAACASRLLGVGSRAPAHVGLSRRSRPAAVLSGDRRR